MPRGNAALRTALLLLLLGGCRGGRDALEQELGDLHSDVLRLRADNAALRERLEATELARASGTLVPAEGPSAATTPYPAGSQTPASVAVPDAGDRPELSIVKLAPPGTREDEDDGEGVARTVLRSTAGGGVVEELSPSVREEASAVQKAYEEGVSQYRAKQWAKALDTLGAFVISHPGHDLTDDAMYYRGAVYVGKGELRAAADTLESLLSQCPTSNRAPEALADLSEIYRRLGEVEAAEAARTRLSAQFPGSDAARKSREGTTRKRNKSSKESQGARP